MMESSILQIRTNDNFRRNFILPLYTRMDR